MGPAKSNTKKSDIGSAELKARILRVARKHFALHGFQGASLKDIAAETGVANSLLNYHFVDKAGLFAECLEEFAKDKTEVIRRILGEPKGREELIVRLELFVEDMLQQVLDDPYGFEILEREVKSGNVAAIDLFESTLLSAFKSVVEFFGTARSHGLLREDADPLVTAMLLFTSACESAKSEHIAQRFFNLSFGQPEWRKQVARQIVALFTQGVIK